MVGAAENIVAWTVGVGLEGQGRGDLTAGYCDRLVAAGVPLWRASVGADTLHPLIQAQGQRWHFGEPVREEVFARARTPEGEEAEAEWRRSPWYRMIEDQEWQMRRRLERGEGTNEFPLLADLATQGGTDYWARIVAFGNWTASARSAASRRPGRPVSLAALPSAISP
jgi:adenylate cyclase